MLSNSQDQTEGRKRPLGVWLFSLFYGLSGLFHAVGWLLMLSQSVPLSSPEREYYESLSAADYALTFILIFIALVAAITLFFLRKAAVLLFLALLIIGLTQTAWHFSTKELGSVLEGYSLVGMLMQWSLLTWACIYSWHLRRKGLLR